MERDRMERPKGKPEAGTGRGETKKERRKLTERGRKLSEKGGGGGGCFRFFKPFFRPRRMGISKWRPAGHVTRWLLPLSPSASNSNFKNSISHFDCCCLIESSLKLI